MPLNEFTLCLLIIIQCAWNPAQCLLFPASSVLQVIGTISVPAEILPKDQKLFFDWGLQMNYNFPTNLSTFYNLPIWPGLQIAKRDTGLHGKDLMADKFYNMLERLLLNYNYHRSCLLLAICELAQQPFDQQNSHLLVDLLTFILKPSLHREYVEQNIYEQAEFWGLQGNNCSRAYPKCFSSPLASISKIIEVD